MRVFVTGATGFIGSAVVQELINAGHEVIGLVRSESSAKKLIAGARAHIGSIEDVECLRHGAAGADAAIHLAFFQSPFDATLWKQMRIFFGGFPWAIIQRFFAVAVEVDVRAVETISAALSGSKRALVVVLPTMAMAPNRLASELDAPDADSAGGPRAVSETTALSLTSRGIRASVVRLPPAVHDGTKAGAVSWMIPIARKASESAYTGNGLNRWAAVHVLDAARLLRLVVEKGAAGARYHAVAEQGIPVKDIAAAIGAGLNVPVVSKTEDAAAKHFGFLARFIAVDNPVSSDLTQKQLGWKPTHPGLIADLQQGKFFDA